MLAVHRKRKGTIRRDPSNMKRFKLLDESASMEPKEDGNTGKPSKILDRKTRRKEERKLKKMRKTAFTHRKPIPTIETIKQEKEKKIKDEKAAKRKEKKRLSQKRRKRKQRLRKQEDQPNEPDTKVQGLMEANKQEDKMIKQLERQLKLNKRKAKTLPQAFLNDGLDFVLDAVDPDKAAVFYEEENEKSELKNLGLSDSDNEISNSGSENEPINEESSQDESDEEDFLLPTSQKLEKGKGMKVSDSSEEKHSKEKPGRVDKPKESKKVKFKEIDSKNKLTNTKDTSRPSEMADSVSEDDDESDDDNESSEDEDVDNVKQSLESSEDSDENLSSDELESDPSESAGRDSDSVDSETEESTYKEDIYGRLRDKQGNFVQETFKKGAYIPPGKRAMMYGNDDKRRLILERIQRQLKGFINRLSESNLQNISNQIEELYRNHSRADMNESLISVIFGACISPVIIPERLVTEQALLVAVLHGNVGSEVGATFLQKVAQQVYENHPVNKDTKELHNILTFLAHLYNFKVVHSLLLCDIMKKLVESFTERDIELILLLLRTVGFSLRKDDPVSLKNLILQIQNKSAKVNTQDYEDPSRVKFMLETLTAIKNNNMRKIPNYDPSHVEHLRKLLRNFVRVTSVSESQLRISLEDLRNAEEKGKWWLVGSAWSGRETDQDTSEKDSSTPSSLSNISKDILELARKQRMNTDVRKSIFCVIMTSEDFVDAFEKLLRLGLKHQQEREIIHVLLDVSLQEKMFNPYYAFLAQKFCEYDRRFQMTLQFNSWDRFKMMSTYTDQQRSNLAQLFVHLLTTKALSLSVFKVLEFSELDKGKVRFLKQVLCDILLKYEDYTVKDVFVRIAPFPKLAVLREGLVLFMKHFILNKKSEDSNLISQRIQIAEKALSSNDGSTAL